MTTITHRPGSTLTNTRTDTHTPTNKRTRTGAPAGPASATARRACCGRTRTTPPTGSTRSWSPRRRACALRASLLVLGLTAAVQAVVAALSGTVALLGDTEDNAADAR
ncbi:hypothetical protein GCM10010195_41420 [Kitasatospora griseola]|nr:hypothetical protein GCM10010195_41420 [Kitasatospora griseola]